MLLGLVLYTNVCRVQTWSSLLHCRGTLLCHTNALQQWVIKGKLSTILPHLITFIDFTQQDILISLHTIARFVFKEYTQQETWNYLPLRLQTNVAVKLTRPVAYNNQAPATVITFPGKRKVKQLTSPVCLLLLFILH